MVYAVDTNVLLRWVQPRHPQNASAVRAVRNLNTRGEAIVTLAQNAVEFWNVATRPLGANGLGWSIARADGELRTIEGLFRVLRDTSVVYDEWRNLVVSAGVSGVQVHDARIAAAVRVLGVDRLVTFNVADFARFSIVTAIHPDDV